MSKTNAETPVANAVVLRHIKVTPKAAPGPRQAKPEKPKQKQNNVWPLKHVLDLLANPLSTKKPSVNGQVLVKQIGTQPNSKGLYRFETANGKVVALKKDAQVEVIDDVTAIKAKAQGIKALPTIEEIVKQEQADERNGEGYYGRGLDSTEEERPLGEALKRLTADLGL